MSDSTKAVGAPAVAANILALSIAVCAVEVTPLRGVGGFAITVAGKVPGKSVEMMEPDPLETGMFTEIEAML